MRSVLMFVVPVVLSLAASGCGSTRYECCYNKEYYDCKSKALLDSCAAGMVDECTRDTSRDSICATD